MGSCLAKICPCIFPPPDEPEERLMPLRQLTCKIMVIGNISVGKTTLIKCLVNGKSMKGVDIQRTVTYDVGEAYTIDLPDMNAKLTIKFHDVAGVNGAP